MDDVWCYAAFLIAVIGIRIGVQIFEPDDIIGKDFCTDLDELEYRLEEWIYQVVVLNELFAIFVNWIMGRMIGL